MAIQYSKVSSKSLSNAIAKAKQVKPRVRVSGFNNFEVTGSKGDVYHCSFTKDKDGDFVGLCDCPANRKNKICYHVCACATLYKQQIFERAQARSLSIVEAAAQPVELPSCEYCNSELDSDGFCTKAECNPTARAAQLAKDYADLFGA